LVDNGSPDNTVEVACGEGAILARSFQTGRYDENLHLRHMNDVVSEISESEGAEHIWWLFLDCDEFAHGPRVATENRADGDQANSVAYAPGEIGAADSRYRHSGPRTLIERTD
jgi:hypothetical protein